MVTLLGKSPSVLTELLWGLVREGRRVTGVEIWTTGDGLGSPGTQGLLHQAGALFQKLTTALGPRADQIPHWDAKVPINPASLPARASGYVVHVPTLGDERLADVASRAEAEAFGAQLAARLQQITDVRGPVVGSLAGGRKAMSALFHSAFTLYARPEDRLVHVIIATAVEDDLGHAGMKRYGCPTEVVASLAPDEQLTIYDVPFVSTREAARRWPDSQLRTWHEQAKRQLLCPGTPKVERITWRLAEKLAWLHVGDQYRVGLRVLGMYALLARAGGRPIATSTLADRVGGTVENAERLLNMLAVRMRCHLGADPDLVGLVPKQKGQKWTVKVPAGVDVESLDVDAILPPEASDGPESGGEASDGS